MAGTDPATFRSTVERSSIELHARGGWRAIRTRTAQRALAVFGTAGLTVSLAIRIEATAGIEPARNGFADHGVPISPRRRAPERGVEPRWARSKCACRPFASPDRADAGARTPT